jgi:hypothetical protein
LFFFTKVEKYVADLTYCEDRWRGR